jgi:hypothetical protein
MEDGEGRSDGEGQRKSEQTGEDGLTQGRVDEAEVEKSFWLSRTDGWLINRKLKKIVLLEFKRTSDYGESYFKDMWRVAEKQHTPIMIGLRALPEE